MSMERNTIVEQLKDDLVDYVKTSHDYYIDVSEVTRGARYPETMVNRPAITLECIGDASYKDEMGEHGSEDLRTLSVLITLVHDTEGIGDVIKIFEFASDIEYFLHNDFTYSDTTTIPELGFYEGTHKDPGVLIATLSIIITYDIDDISSR